MSSHQPVNPQTGEKKSSLLDYLKYAPLHSCYYLNSSGTITFHWADWRETCLFQNGYLYQNPFARKKLGDLQAKVDDLREKQVFVKNGDDNIKSYSLFDLYSIYFSEEDFKSWVEREGIKNFSYSKRFEEPRDLMSMQWFDRNDYRKVVYLKILTERVETRGFRLGFNIPLACYYEKSQIDNSMVFIHQVSRDGVMFRFVNLNDYMKFITSKEIHLSIGESYYKNIFSLELEELDDLTNLVAIEETLNEKKRHFSLKTNEVDHCATSLNLPNPNFREFFFFARYDQFECTEDCDIEEVFTSFLNRIEGIFREELKEVL